MGIYQVTQEQYQEVMKTNPSSMKTAVTGESGTPGKLPVERVSWYDALVFCNKLSDREGLDPVYKIKGSTDPAVWGTVPTTGNNVDWDAAVMDTSKNGYRLPTEAEWEYACRAGTTTTYNTGENTVSDNTGWYLDNSSRKTHQVGLKPANAWGLYDMHGNVDEWCWDWYNSNYYSSSPSNDPEGPLSGDERVYRGGNYEENDWKIRSAYRYHTYPYLRYSNQGFRLVRTRTAP
jgi:formylglycine-generating enzyme required for sulfatase activity